MTTPVCPLCRRPNCCPSRGDKWAERSEVVWELEQCRRIALAVSALVAPVVEAATNLVDRRCMSWLDDIPALEDAIDAMKDGLRKIGGRS
jgi:hypothetical protein